MNRFVKLAGSLIAGLSLFIGATAGAQDIDVTIEKEDGVYMGSTPSVLNSHETAFLFHQIGVDNEESNLLFFLKYSSGKGNEINEILLRNEGSTCGELLYESGDSFPVAFTIWDDTPEKYKEFAADVYIAFSPYYVLRSDKKDDIDHIRLATYNMVYSNLVSIKIGNQTIPIKELGFKTAKQFTAIWEKLESINAFTGQNKNLVPLKQKHTASKTSSTPQHEWVDLGLSVKWATCNIGASSPEDYGGYYAWGETDTKAYYDWGSYKFTQSGSWDDVSLSKYITKWSAYHTPIRGTADDKTILDYSDDAARNNWGGEWRIPKQWDWEELERKCTWTWTSQNGINGFKITGENGNSIFLPAAGEKFLDSVRESGSVGFYWTSHLTYGIRDDSKDAHIIQFWEKGKYISDMIRCKGLPIRPVIE